jgi:hypothetical protein
MAMHWLPTYIALGQFRPCLPHRILLYLVVEPEKQLAVEPELFKDNKGEMEMKKVFAILMFLSLCIVSSSFADDIVFDVDFSWEQAQADLPHLDHWVVTMRSVAGGEVEKTFNVPYDGNIKSLFTQQESIDMTGKPGETITKFFACKAVSKNGNETKESEEKSFDFTIPYNDVTVPINFKITVRLHVDTKLNVTK